MKLVTKTWNLGLFVFLLISQGLFAQQTININKESSGLRSTGQLMPEQAGNYALGKPKQARLFDINPQLKSLTSDNKGDILLLDLFEDKQFRASVEQVTHGYNGITGITAKVEGMDFSYCYISASDEGTLIHVDLVEKNAYYIATTNAEGGYLRAYNKEELNKQRLACQSVLPPEQPEIISFEPQQISNSPLQTTAGLTTRADELEEVTINVMVVYTEKAMLYAKTQEEASIENMITLAMQKANQASINSGIGIIFNLVHSYQTDYVEVNNSADLNHLTSPTDGKMDEVHPLRRQYGADLVMFVPEVDFTGGVGWLMTSTIGNPAYGFALSRVQQLSWTTTMVHEMAHNMGCGHHKDQSKQPGPGLYDYSSGWKGIINGQNQCTIMTYGNAYYWDGITSYEEIPYFSSPDIDYQESGVYIGDAQTADNARTLRQNKHATATYKTLIRNTLLTDLKVDGVTIEGFDPDKATYTYRTEKDTVTIEGISSSTVKGNITKAYLDHGNNVFTLSVSSANKYYGKTYQVIVNRVAVACDSSPSDPSFSDNVTAPSGDDDLNLDMKAGTLTKQSPYIISLVEGLTPIYVRENSSSTNCHTYSNGGNFNVYWKELRIKVTKDGNYTFTGNDNLIMTLFSTETPSCTGFLDSSGYWTGSSSTSTGYGKSVTASLKANTTYYLRIMLYSQPTTQFRITASGPGTSYAEAATPDGMSYTYIAVDQSDNKIKKHSPTADFRTLPNGSYTIYGVPYSYGSQANSFIGKTVSEIQNSACVILSRTSINMTVSDQPPTYGVSIGSFAGGSVRAASPGSSNGSAVLAGETVTLTISITDGYQLDSIAAYKTGSQATGVSLSGSGNQNGATRTFTMPKYGVTVTALFTKTQEKQDEEAVEAAVEAVEGGTYRVAQTAGNTEESLRTWLVNTLNNLFGSSHKVEFRSSGSSMVGNVEILSFSPAVAGTKESPDGRNGSFTYTVTLMLGATTLSTETTSGTILAIPYTETPEKRIELSLLNELTVHILNSGNVATGELTLALSGTNADVFTLPSATVASLAIGAETDVTLSVDDDLPIGTYKATLTVSAEDLTAVSQAITYVSTGTALDGSQAETLKAGVQSGTLYVSGLTPGQPWSVYIISGILIHHDLAESGEASIPLPSRGVYIITSGTDRVKVVY
ncbi:zinc-dependent metalloprotease [Parabacteroides sp. OttesenSCG-928-J18]|nr:zinc-dependent metalloprotease [Parabacteroides sp. OttesenSCG-928-J18]